MFGKKEPNSMFINTDFSKIYARLDTLTELLNIIDKTHLEIQEDTDSGDPVTEWNFRQLGGAVKAMHATAECLRHDANSIIDFLEDAPFH